MMKCKSWKRLASACLILAPCLLAQVECRGDTSVAQSPDVGAHGDASTPSDPGSLCKNGSTQLQLDNLRLVHHDGQTFVQWTDHAAAELGANYRYNVYRASTPISAATLASAQVVAKGVLNNAAILFGHGFYANQRLDATAPMSIIETGGAALPRWSGLVVSTAPKNGCAYFAVETTTIAGAIVAAVVPGKNASLKPLAEQVAPRAPIKLHDSKDRGPYWKQTYVTGKPHLPLYVHLHSSEGGGGGAGEYGDYYLYFGSPQMGYRDGMAGVFSVDETHSGAQYLILHNRDAIVTPLGLPLETAWFGYAAVPQWASHTEPRAYPFTENRLLWAIEWTKTRYQVDPNRVYCGGGSMGAWGATSFCFHHAELFAAVFPDRPRVIQRDLPRVVTAPPESTRMDDGKTPYLSRLDSVRFASEHKEDLPFYGWGIGRNDGFAPWLDQIKMVRALTQSRHGFAFAWDNGDHGSPVIGEVKKWYPQEKFALHQSYPAFSHSSIDGNLGDGAVGSGDLSGGINLGFDWTNVVDEAKEWSASLSNALAAGAMTVDVTPRRRQKFKPPPGTKVFWTNSFGGSGNAVVDAAGLLTVPGVQLPSAGRTTRLKLTAP